MASRNASGAPLALVRVRGAWPAGSRCNRVRYALYAAIKPTRPFPARTSPRNGRSTLVLLARVQRECTRFQRRPCCELVYNYRRLREFEMRKVVNADGRGIEETRATNVLSLWKERERERESESGSSIFLTWRTSMLPTAQLRELRSSRCNATRKLPRGPAEMPEIEYYPLRMSAREPYERRWNVEQRDASQWHRELVLCMGIRKRANSAPAFSTGKTFCPGR